MGGPRPCRECVKVEYVIFLCVWKCVLSEWEVLGPVGSAYTCLAGFVKARWCGVG